MQSVIGISDKPVVPATQLEDYRVLRVSPIFFTSQFFSLKENSQLQKQHLLPNDSGCFFFTTNGNGKIMILEKGLKMNLFPAQGSYSGICVKNINGLMDVVNVCVFLLSSIDLFESVSTLI